MKNVSIYYMRFTISVQDELLLKIKIEISFKKTYGLFKIFILIDYSLTCAYLLKVNTATADYLC